MITDRLQDMLFLPLSMIAFNQCNALIEMLDNIQSEADKDLWKFQWNSSGCSTRKVYLELNKYPKAPVIFKWIWKSPCLSKHKFFFWLMIQDRVNTRDLLTRKNFHVESTSCVLCDDSVLETMPHLFFSCKFSTEFWEKLGETRETELQLNEMIMEAKNRSVNSFFKIAMMAGCWSLWNHRNKIIFDNEQRNLNTCYMFFKLAIEDIRHRVKPSLKEGMQNWLDNL